MATYFKCDGCGREIGNKAHVTLLMVGGNATGIALPPIPTTVEKKGTSTTTRNGRGWKTVRNIQGQFHHFHDGDCAKRFFDRKLKEALTQV